jgi:hypothetical protein
MNVLQRRFSPAVLSGGTAHMLQCACVTCIDRALIAGLARVTHAVEWMLRHESVCGVSQLPRYREIQVQ